MSTARDYLAAVQQRADGIRYWDDVTGLLPDTKRLVDFAREVLAMADDLTAADGPHPSHDHLCPDEVAQRLRNIAETTLALTPKEVDS